MTTDQIQFYLRHRKQISEWASLQKRVDMLMRDAVAIGSSETAIKLLNGEVGDADVDFYVRNRAMITEWDALQVPAGLALHDALIAATQQAGGGAGTGKLGWSSAQLSTPELVNLREDHETWVEMAWTKQHLLSTRRGYPFPRLALVLRPPRWHGEERARVIEATRTVAHELGMKRRENWWVYWCELPGISESQGLHAYAEDCVSRLQEASERIYPALRDAVLAATDSVGVRRGLEDEIAEAARPAL